MSIEERPFRWRSIALPALLPTLLFSIGEGAILPVIPVVADNLGASLAVAGLIAALVTVGALFGSIPSGWVISRIGERTAMIGATGVAMLGLAICLLAPNPVILGVGILLVGLAGAVFGLARHAFLTSFVPLAYRARALSSLGGTNRLGLLIGPFLTAAVIHLTGLASFAFWVYLVACVACIVVLLVLPDPETTFGAVHTVRVGNRELRDGEALVELETTGLWGTLRKNRGMLARLGVGASLIGALRASRQVVVPLWAVSIGVSDTNTALIIGIAAAIDFALFYTGGQIMDRFGRLWTVVPAMIGLGLGHLVLAVTHDLPTNVGWFVFAVMFLALANGVSSGALLTLGSDLADPRNPAPFLGAWRFTSGLGGAAAPLVVSAITAFASIAIAAGSIGILGFVGAAILLRYLPRYVPRISRGRAVGPEPAPE
jgi:MFS family permease